MYAVIQSGGKQYRVQPGDVVQVEKLEQEGETGEGAPKGVNFTLPEVLMVAEGEKVWLGKPLLEGAKVECEVVGQGRGEKILIIKMKRRKQYRRTQGHRQYYTQLLVTGISNGSGETATLSDPEKKAKLANFQSHLRAKGEAFTPKSPGKKALAKAKLAGTTQAAAGKTAAKKTSKAAPKAATKKATK
jgi:large subunit ribosomal protein L21